MNNFKKIILSICLVFLLAPIVLAQESENNASGILIGMEYVTDGLGVTLAEIGAPAVKYIPNEYSWEKMQRSPNAPIDFSVTDRYVREFQSAGFKNLVISLISRNRWASKAAGILQLGNPSPKPQYMDVYARWVAAIVERYDGDGVNDMPGLLYPVRRFEIGVEFSTYEPEPVDDYLEMLAVAYKAAHAASDKVIIAHVPFFDAGIYDGSINYPQKHILHPVGDVYKILDRPDIFDTINLHALFSPYEIEKTVKWLKNQMHQRGYSKPIMISDTSPNAFSLFGHADTCQGPKQNLGFLTAPVIEADRCRLAKYFTKLLNGNSEVVRWTQGYCAQDNVQKVVIAAEQGVTWIDTAFTEDLGILKSKLVRGGAGAAAWAGFVERRGNRVVERRAPFYALKQLVGHMQGYRSIRRVPANDDRVRLYELDKPGSRLWIAWVDPKELILPGDDVPKINVSIETGADNVYVEPMITKFGQAQPDRSSEDTKAGVATLTLTPTPIYVWSK